MLGTLLVCTCASQLPSHAEASTLHRTTDNRKQTLFLITRATIQLMQAWVSLCFLIFQVPLAGLILY